MNYVVVILTRAPTRASLYWLVVRDLDDFQTKAFAGLDVSKTRSIFLEKNLFGQFERDRKSPQTRKIIFFVC